MAILITGVFLILLASCTSFHSNSQSNHRCWLHDQEQLAKHETFYEKCIHFPQQTPKHQSLCHQNKVSNCLMWSWPLTIRIPLKNTWRSFHFFLGRLWSHSIWAVRLMFAVDLCVWVSCCLNSQSNSQSKASTDGWLCRLLTFSFQCIEWRLHAVIGNLVPCFVEPWYSATTAFARIPRLPLLRTWNCWKYCQLIAPSGPISVVIYWMVLSFKLVQTFGCCLSCTGLVALIDGASGICRVSFLCWEAEGPRSGFQPRWHNILRLSRQC